MGAGPEDKRGNDKEKRDPTDGNGTAREGLGKENDGAPHAAEGFAGVQEGGKENQQMPERGEKRHFRKRKVMGSVAYSFGNLDVYLHNRYSDVRPIFRALIELAVVFVLFLTCPAIAILIDKDFGFNDVPDLFTGNTTSDLHSYVKKSLFVTLTYLIFTMTNIAVGNIVYVLVYIFYLLDIQVIGAVQTALQILANSRKHLRNFLTALLVFYLAETIYGEYVLFNRRIDMFHLMMTFLLWYCMFSLMLFGESVLVSVIMNELCRRSISGRIFDANYKTFVFKKLVLIAQSKPYGEQRMRRIIGSINNEFESSLYLRHNDLNITSAEHAEDIAESIFGHLEVDSLDFESIKEFFPENYDEVYRYLSKGRSREEAQRISFETVKDQALELYKERADILLSLLDQDSVLNRLNVVLLCGVSFLGMVLMLLLFNVDYKVYLASVGPLIFTFGWIFQGTVLEMYRCFVFLLFSHPFDSGDRVVIDGVELIVIAIDLLYTTFRDDNGMVTYIPNVVLFTKSIGNVRRSDIESEDVCLEVDGSTSFSKVLDLRERLQASLQKAEDKFTGAVLMKKYEASGGNVRITLSVQHMSNFQDPVSRLARRAEFVEKLEGDLSRAGIGYTRGYTFYP